MYGDPEPNRVLFEGAKSLATLAIGPVLGGVLKLATDNYADARRSGDERPRLEREEREERAKRFDALIADMHDNHDRLETTRLLIAANRSAKTYGERVREIIDAHVLLLKIARAKWPAVIEPTAEDAERLQWMLAYLLALQLEYGERYKRVADFQRYDDELTRQRFVASATSRMRGDDTDVPAASDLAWRQLHKHELFPVLDDSCARGTQYETHFIESCGALAESLRAAKCAGLPAPRSTSAWPDDATLRKDVEAKAGLIREKCADAKQCPFRAAELVAAD